VGVLSVLPVVVVSALVTFYLKSNLQDYFPVGGDSATYWQEIANFAKVGFHSGHSGFEETAAPAAKLGIGTFGSHSQWFPMLYGCIAKMIGWGPATVSFINIVLVSLSLGAMAWLMKGTIRFNLFCAVFLATSLYILTFLPIMMMEALQYCISFILAGLFYRRLTLSRKAPSWLGPCLWGTIMLAALTRYSWGILFFAYYMPVSRLRSGNAWLACLAKGLCFTVLGFSLYTYFAAPYPYEPFPGSVFGIKVYVSMLHGDVGPFLTLFKTNILGVFHPGRVTVQLVLFWIIIFYFIAAPILSLFERDDSLASDSRSGLALAIFHCINLGGILAAVTLYYYTTLGMVGLRQSMPQFACTFLVLARSIRIRWLIPVLVFQVVSIPSSIITFMDNMEAEYNSYQQNIARHETGKLFKLIKYNKNALSPWCNTVLFFGGYGFGVYMLMIPPEISINDMRLPAEDELLTPLKSAWIITDNQRASDVLKQVSGVEILGSSGVWTLYSNSNVQCHQFER
jgi:uncharacterized membrane protein YciS (DUF1049 family)